MKKNYEKWSLWIVLVIGTYLLLALFISFISFTKINTYKRFQGVSIKENMLEVVIPSKDLELFEDNSCLYIKNKKYKYTIKEVNRNMVKDGHILLLEIKNIKNEKGKEIISFSIFHKKVKIRKMFEIIWKEDLDGEA